jgi:tRNA-dihydrouridine synthase A
MVKQSPPAVKRTFTTAPMMDWSDRHCRAFWRLLTKNAVLYSEMVTTGAILNNDPQRYLQFNNSEHPIALQLGGSNPQELARAAKIGEEFGYDEINLNVGCPSDRVQNNMIGACMMAHPELVADCMQAMAENCSIPVTIKHRIGIDDMADYDHLYRFVERIHQSGTHTFIIHARKAILQGLSPKENREIPPLIYDFVYDIKKAFPELEIIINGGLADLDAMQSQLQHVDGVMVGREAYHNPWILSEVDSRFYGAERFNRSRHEVVEAFFPYMEEELQKGNRIAYMSRHILGIFNGLPGARQFRRHISENAHKKEADLSLIKEALSFVPRELTSI